MATITTFADAERTESEKEREKHRTQSTKQIPNKKF